MRTFTIMNKYVTQRNALAVSAAIVLFSLVAFVLSIARSRSGDFAAVSRHAATPKTILWAWERPTDLSFIDPQQVGVAFLARTIRLKADDVVVKPRLQKLSLPVSAKLIAVARIESDLKNRPALSASQKDVLVKRISEMAVQPNVDNIQIDFDATQSEREFYRTVILAVRHHLPDRVGLSITALASWCADDDWLSDLPIDEAV